MLLVDAERFLREYYHDQPVIRANLNEPEPHLGIPPNSYDTVQRSLTGPIHLWHLYQTVTYHIDHNTELQSLPAISVSNRHSRCGSAATGP